jgi:3-deoxy-D-manno-octulosonate 8-phosphate phosphatase (KDO 8-P phosphatase)
MIKNLVFDCDGTLTDGKYYYSKRGKELVSFHANDSVAMMYAKRLGMRVIMISSGSYQGINKKRAKDLGIEHYYAPLFKKLDVLISVGVNMDETAYLGDCFDDIPVLDAAELGFVPSDALPDIKEHSDYLLSRSGGSGCLLEAWAYIEKYNEQWIKNH